MEISDSNQYILVTIANPGQAPEIMSKEFLDEVV